MTPDVRAAIGAFALKHGGVGRREVEADPGERVRGAGADHPATVGGFDERRKFSMHGGHNRPGSRHVIENLVLEHRPKKRVRPRAQDAHIRRGQVAEHLGLRHGSVKDGIRQTQSGGVPAELVTVIAVAHNQEPDTASFQNLRGLEQRFEAVPTPQGADVRANEVLFRIQREVRDSFDWHVDHPVVHAVRHEHDLTGRATPFDDSGLDPGTQRDQGVGSGVEKPLDLFDESYEEPASENACDDGRLRPEVADLEDESGSS